ncbi:MAG TPA: hypothetical protein VF155_11025 [Candidatus Dormibacteraeota bacterium]
MAKPRIVKLWRRGWVAVAAGFVLSTGAFYTQLDFNVPLGIALYVVSGALALGGFVATVVAHVGALRNTHRLGLKGWFHTLLWTWIAGAAVCLAMTVAGLVSGVTYLSGIGGFVWGALIIGSMSAYVWAAPDSEATPRPQGATASATPVPTR